MFLKIKNLNAWSEFHVNSSMDTLGFKRKTNALQQNASLYIHQVISMDFE